MRKRVRDARHERVYALVRHGVGGANFFLRVSVRARRLERPRFAPPRGHPEERRASLRRQTRVEDVRDVFFLVSFVRPSSRPAVRNGRPHSANLHGRAVVDQVPVPAHLQRADHGVQTGELERRPVGEPNARRRRTNRAVVVSFVVVVATLALFFFSSRNKLRLVLLGDVHPLDGGFRVPSQVERGGPRPTRPRRRFNTGHLVLPPNELTPGELELHGAVAPPVQVRAHKRRGRRARRQDHRGRIQFFFFRKVFFVVRVRLVPRRVVFTARLILRGRK